VDQASKALGSLTARLALQLAMEQQDEDCLAGGASSEATQLFIKLGPSGIQFWWVDSMTSIVPGSGAVQQHIVVSMAHVHAVGAPAPSVCWLHPVLCSQPLPCCILASS
jgi:hypothetical protein